MSNPKSPVFAELVGHGSQSIAFALIMSVVIFGCGVFVFATGDRPQFPSSTLIVLNGMSGLVAAVYVFMQFVNPDKAALKMLSADFQIHMLAFHYLSKTVSGMVQLAVVAFISLVAYIVDGQLSSYGVVALLLGVMAISFPSQGQFESWAEEMKRELN